MIYHDLPTALQDGFQVYDRRPDSNGNLLLRRRNNGHWELAVLVL